jgi:hypothetical protein
MRRGADKLDASVECLVIRLGSFEAREERVMDIDSAARELLAQIVRQNLHVARQNHELSLSFVDDFQQFAFLLRFRFGRNGQIDKPNAFALSHRAHVQMVRHDCRDVHRQLALAVAVEKVTQAVVKLAYHQEDVRRSLAVDEFPFHAEVFGNCWKIAAQLLNVALAVLIEAEDCPHEERARCFFIELRELADVAAGVGEKRRDRRDDTRSSGATDGENEILAHCATPLEMLMFSNRADAQKRTAALTLSNGRVFDQLDMRNEVAST